MPDLGRRWLFLKVVRICNKSYQLIYQQRARYFTQRRPSFSSRQYAYLTFQSFVCTWVTDSYQTDSFSKETSCYRFSSRDAGASGHSETHS
jgi:hypothetical protein